MSVAILLRALLCLAPPDGPPPPPSEPPAPEDAPIDIQPGGTPAQPKPELELDDRYDPILPYGEARDPGAELEYADETPPPPELEYADETPPPPELEYDQDHQRVVPSEAALARQADEQDELGKPAWGGRAESPQRFALELKFGPYLPDIDRSYTGAGLGPYANVFGEQGDDGRATAQPKQGLFSVLGFEWQFYHLGGAFSLGTTFGLFRDKAQALQLEPNETTGNYRNAADEATFNVVPITLLLGYRFELLADRFKVPLVPYARGGLAYGFWWATKGGSISTTVDGQKTRGGSLGWQANLGLMLRLDFIDRATAVDLDRNTGINHTYLFGEWQFSRLDGFGSDKRLSIGADTYLFGFAVAF